MRQNLPYWCVRACGVGDNAVRPCRRVLCALRCFSGGMTDMLVFTCLAGHLWPGAEGWEEHR